jgi:hypothetical protein
MLPVWIALVDKFSSRSAAHKQVRLLCIDCLNSSSLHYKRPPCVVHAIYVCERPTCDCFSLLPVRGGRHSVVWCAKVVWIPVWTALVGNSLPLTLY